MDWKIELIGIPVSDIEVAKTFYERVGFVTDHDHQVDESLRFVQLTPPGSACSIMLDVASHEVPAGSVKGMQVVVPDADEARTHLLDRDVPASEIDDQPWGRFVYFSDPDGNAWSLQQIPDW